MGKAAKRARKKQGKRDRKEAEEKAAEKRRKRNVNIGIGVAVLAVVVLLGIHQLTKKSTTKVTAGSTPTATAAASSAPTPSPAASAAAGATTTAASCPSAAKPAQGDHATQPSPPPMTISKTTTYTAAFVTSCGNFTITLDAKESPNTVNSFVYLAKKGFFNGLDFHRISHSVNVIQGGDPNGDGSGDPGYQVVDPVPSSLSGGVYPAGAVAMAKTSAAPNGSAGSQFFIVAPGQTSQIGPDYALLGNVTSGSDTVGRIWADIPSGQSSYDGAPEVPVYIDTVTVSP